MKISGIRCDKCGTIHNESEETFFTVSGNICIGLSGGIVGNNIIQKQGSEKITVNDSHYCLQCLCKTIEENSNAYKNRPVVQGHPKSR